MVVYVAFLRDVACQKLLNSANVSRSYSQNNTGTVFLRHGVDVHGQAIFSEAGGQTYHQTDVYSLYASSAVYNVC